MGDLCVVDALKKNGAKSIVLKLNYVTGRSAGRVAEVDHRSPPVDRAGVRIDVVQGTGCRRDCGVRGVFDEEKERRACGGDPADGLGAADQSRVAVQLLITDDTPGPDPVGNKEWLE